MGNLFLLSFTGETKSMITIIVIGAIAGLLAQLLSRGRSFGMVFTIILGIVGGYVGNMFLKKWLYVTDSLLINQIITATVGAIVLALTINLIFGRNRGRDKTMWRA